MKNLKLFSDEPEPLLVDPARPDPAFWIQRLVLIESLSADARVIRPIEFRRGLNIIDTAIHPGDDTATVGHSVGKTLMLRLIRYCLGERGFGSPVVRQAVAEQFPTGYVLAEVDVAGITWVIARPIGFDSAGQTSFARANTTIEAFLLRESHRERLGTFVEEMHRRVTQPLESVKLPHADRRIEWLDVLAWLSRDQACRHRSHTEWRPPGPDGRGLNTEDCHFLIRAAMDLLSPDDVDRITGHKRLLRRRGKTLRAIDTERNVLSRQQDELATALSLGDDSSEYEQFAAAAENAARQQKESLARLLDEEIGKSPLPEVQTRYSGVVKEIGGIDQILTSLRQDEEATRDEIRQIEESSETEMLLTLADQGHWCHLFPTKSEAVDKGCPGTAAHDPGLTNPNRDKQLRELQLDLSAIRNDIKREDERLTEKTGVAAKLLVEVQQEQSRMEKLRAPVRQRIERYALLEESAKSYRRKSEAFHTMIDSSTSLKTQIRESLEMRRAVDQRFQVHLGTITNCFRHVLSTLLGHRTDARIEINAKGIYPRPAEAEGVRGEAIGTSTTVLGFDLACLAASIGGLGHHPRFLIHDSPREADMEEPMYHRLFRLVLHLEALFGISEPSFQYIVTTTTPPPDELRGTPHFRLTLDARSPDSLLLGRRF